MKRALMLGVLVPLFAAVATAAHAQQIDACLGSAGKLRVLDEGEACKAGEQFVAWNVSGPQGPVGPQGPAGPAGTGGLRIEDADGRVVGVVTDTGGAYPTILMRVGGTVVRVTVSPEGILPEWNYTSYYYAEPGCVGTRALLPPSHVTGDVFYESSIEVGAGLLAFPTGSRVDFSYASRTVRTPYGAYCENITGTDRMRLVAVVAIDSLGFRAPFVMRGLPGEP